MPSLQESGLHGEVDPGEAHLHERHSETSEPTPEKEPEVPASSILHLVSTSQNHRHTLLPQQKPKQKTPHNLSLDTSLPAEAWEDVSESIEEVPRPEMSPSPRGDHRRT